CFSKSKSALRSIRRASKRCSSCAAMPPKSKTERDEGLSAVCYRRLRAAVVSNDAAAARATRPVRARPRARAVRLLGPQPSDGRGGRRNVSVGILRRRILEQRPRPQRVRAVARVHHGLSELARDLGAQPAAQRVRGFPLLLGQRGIAHAIMGDGAHHGALWYRQPTLYICRRDHGCPAGAGAVLGAEARAELSRADENTRMISLSSQKEVPPEFRRRTQLLVALVCLVFVFLFGRLLYLQVLDGERYTYLSENNRIRLKKVPGTRGMVRDRRGQLMVDSRPSFDLLFVPEDSDQPEQTLRSLARYLGRPEEELVKPFKDDKYRSPFDEIVLGRDIDWRSVVVVESHQLDLPGVSLRTRPRRNYLDTGMAAHLIAYLGEIGPRQLKTQKANDYSMGDEIGQAGLERRWEEYLRGQAGGQQVEVDALGRRVRVLHEVEDVPGYNIVLTVDRDVQDAAQEAMKGKEGAIVALDVRSGAVLAMVSAPQFDPNIFARGVTADEWRSYMNDRAHPMNNRAIQGQYPPGSTFKIVLGLAALEEGAVQPDTHLGCAGAFPFGNHVFRDWKKEGHGSVDLRRGIVQSCDVYFYQVGNKLGVDKIAKWARALGLGE